MPEVKNIQNLEPVGIRQIPLIDFPEFSDILIREVRSGKRVLQFFGMQRKDDIRIFVILAEDAASRLHITSTAIEPGGKYPALTKHLPSMQLFERELAESFGVYPAGHPWLKPVRFHGMRGVYPFFHMKGEEVHEVGVGPVHAGIIEPGHFRFSCHGEVVDHLEISLGYQHRGVETLFIDRQDHPHTLLRLAESIAGDSVIGHGGAFVQAMEALSGVSLNRRITSLRAIALELERIGNHLGDLSALSADIAYQTGYAVFGAMRTNIINTSLAICGSRFGRGFLRPGGVTFDLDPELIKQIRETLAMIEDRTGLAGEVLFNTSSVMARFEKTGIVTRETAASIGMVGPAARASGLQLDARADHPYGAYKRFPVHPLTLESGDVFARAYIRYAEIMQSIRMIDALLSHLESGAIFEKPSALKSDALVVSISEGWRGEIVHTVLTGRNGKLIRYKIKDPSFNNWTGLALAVRENGISDFPLCNKSFNLSYCGFDL